jgi:hypothetical protein
VATSSAKLVLLFCLAPTVFWHGEVVQGPVSWFVLLLEWIRLRTFENVRIVTSVFAAQLPASCRATELDKPGIS